ncbi:hypothetical protein SS50377_27641 [Spironucleus salmonicida]|uniref:Uncharacterized protein n=1 Tax=Spironucleus salmonicida TaxID=348837 RepID=V6LSB0_9EUKA|nr:hypothetical protein SS50377_27641 [Spironucleus salmonicida]|eukprot:EST46581.1 Hypothetical protein SS50377_13385 [Spironucleus salmonicida]
MSIDNLVDANKKLRFNLHSLYQTNKILEDKNERLKESIQHSAVILKQTQSNTSHNNISTDIQLHNEQLEEQRCRYVQQQQQLNEDHSILKSQFQDAMINIHESFEQRLDQVKIDIKYISDESQQIILKTKLLQDHNDELNKLLIKRSAPSEKASRVRMAELEILIDNLQIQNQNLQQQNMLCIADIDSIKDEELSSLLEENTNLKDTIRLLQDKLQQLNAIRNQDQNIPENTDIINNNVTFIQQQFQMLQFISQGNTIRKLAEMIKLEPTEIAISQEDINRTQYDDLSKILDILNLKTKISQLKDKNSLKDQQIQKLNYKLSTIMQ